MTLDERIIEITAADLHWEFSESRPVWFNRPRKGYKRHSPVDPFPCYPHNRELVRMLAHDVEWRFPLEVPPMWYLPRFEDFGRTNGWAFEGQHYNSNESAYDIDPFVVLQGKRIPPHPALTRYLVGHEYGHVVQYTLQRALKQQEQEFERKYAEMRGIEFRDDYGGNRWHTNTGEILVNDFRVVIAGMEVDFWPHECPSPLGLPHVVKFWRELQEPRLKASPTPV